MTTDIPALKRQLTDAGLSHGPLHEALDELERTRAERDELRAAVGRVETEKCEAIDWAKHQHRAADRYAAQLDSTLKDRTMILVERDRTFALMLARAEAKLAEWQASQHYSYIGRDGKTVLARALEGRAEADRDRLAGELAAALEALKSR